MVELADILRPLDRRKQKILLAAETALSPEAFRAFRKLFLDELGYSGLVKDLQGLFGSDRQKSGQGSGRLTQQGKGDDHA